jgi:alpha-glucosidase
MGEYVNDKRLHMGYSFELLTDDFTAAHIRATAEDLEAKMADGWPCWAISNHDVQRALTRWGGAGATDALAKQLVALVCSLRGSVCLYQGEELGLGEADVPYEALQDPYGKTFWPNFKGRDGCRTPMPWTGGTHAGFTSGQPWLPVADTHRALAVEVQERDPESTLNATRAFLRWRKSVPALQWGDIDFFDTSEPVLAFVRRFEDQRVLAVFNLSAVPVQWPVPPGLQLRALDGHGLLQGGVEAEHVRLPARGLFYAEVG